jgi:hypothetical protein
VVISALECPPEPELIASGDSMESRRAMSDPTELPLPYQPDSPNANFSYWAKMSEWNYEEAAAVLVGINPNRLKLDEAKLRVSVTADALSRYKGIRELAIRAYSDIDFQGSPPAKWLEWARKISLPIPVQLEAEVQKQQIASQPKKDEFGARLADLKAAPAKRRVITVEPLAARERESMLKLIIGMAIAGYRYDPRAKRNDSVREITNDLEKHGVALSDDTVRKYLTEGAELVPPKENSER